MTSMICYMSSKTTGPLSILIIRKWYHFLIINILRGPVRKTIISRHQKVLRMTFEGLLRHLLLRGLDLYTYFTHKHTAEFWAW